MSFGIACPYCHCTRSRVTDKRDHVGHVRRRRLCLECGRRFTTQEAVYQRGLGLCTASTGWTPIRNAGARCR